MGAGEWCHHGIRRGGFDLPTHGCARLSHVWGKGDPGLLWTLCTPLGRQHTALAPASHSRVAWAGPTKGIQPVTFSTSHIIFCCPIAFSLYPLPLFPFCSFLGG